MRVPLIILLLYLALLGPTWSGEPRMPLYDGTPTIRVTRVALDAEDPQRRTVGPLTYLGGLHLSSDDPAFGGFSAMAVRRDRFLLVSDGGLTFGFTMTPDLAPRDYAFGMLPDGPGAGWMKRDRDSESLAVDPSSGRMWVGFERANAVWRYAADLSRAEASRSPPEMAGWPVNGGAEAMVRLVDGRFLIVSEGAADPAGGRQALLFDRDPTNPAARSQRWRMTMPPGYLPTEAAFLPDGGLLILARAATLGDGFTAKLLLASPRDIARGVIRSRTLATFAYPLLHDNFEGLAVTREGPESDRATIVWLLSDDNGPSLFQRTLLLKFRLDLPEDTGQAKRRPD